MLNSITKTFKVSGFNPFSLAVVNKKKFLIIKTKRKKNIYLSIPLLDIIFKTNENALILNYTYLEKESLFTFKQFYELILNFKKGIDVLSKKRIKIKGLGYRISQSENLKFLIFKLGYSHVCVLEVPTDELTVSVRKSNVIVEGVEKARIGNFVSKIRSLRIPDNYKGKGFWYKYQKENLKEINKK